MPGLILLSSTVRPGNMVSPPAKSSEPFGEPDGYLLTRRSDFGVDAALDLLATDFDGDGADDVVVLGSSRIEVLWAASGADQSSALERLDVPLPSHEPACFAEFPSPRKALPELIIGTKQETLLRVSARPDRTVGKITVVDAVPATHISAGDLDGDGAYRPRLDEF